jgi:hypothetical protein
MVEDSTVQVPSSGFSEIIIDGNIFNGALDAGAAALAIDAASARFGSVMVSNNTFYAGDEIPVYHITVDGVTSGTYQAVMITHNLFQRGSAAVAWTSDVPGAVVGNTLNDVVIGAAAAPTLWVADNVTL